MKPTYCLYCDQVTRTVHQTPKVCDRAIARRLAAVQKQLDQHFKLLQERDELQADRRVCADMWRSPGGPPPLLPLDKREAYRREGEAYLGTILSGALS